MNVKESIIYDYLCAAVSNLRALEITTPEIEDNSLLLLAKSQIGKAQAILEGKLEIMARDAWEDRT